MSPTRPLRFPRPLQPGDRIGVTSPSAGVRERARPRIEFAIECLRAKGYEVVVGECMSAQQWVSAPKAARAAELTAMLTDPTIRAIVPPWGGPGTALDLLDQLDYPLIAAAEPTWLVGYSDCSTLLVPLTLCTGLATLHGDNLADTPYAPPPGLAHWLDLATAPADPSGRAHVPQRESGIYADWQSFDNPTATTWKDPRPGRWRLHGADHLQVTGTLIGGCIEVMSGIVGSPYADVRRFGAEHGPLIVYLEAAEAGAFEICRFLHQLRYAGWFDFAAAILLGRTNAPAATEEGGMSQEEAVLDALGDLGLPIVFDLEIGHVPPHLPLLNGAQAEVIVDADTRQLNQTWPSRA